MQQPTEQYIQQIYEQRRQLFSEFPYLPLFYLIPEEIAIKRKLADFPRDPNIVVMDEYWRVFQQAFSSNAT